jgi:hypothetical protein
LRDAARSSSETPGFSAMIESTFWVAFCRQTRQWGLETRLKRGSVTYELLVDVTDVPARIIC